MRHQVKGKKLSRNSSQRKALFKSLINALVIHGEIKTTESKAKAIRGLLDKLINKGKKGTLHSRRLIGAFLQDKMAVSRIVDELGPIFAQRTGGFSRITRLGKRRGDDAMMVKLELVEKPAVKEKILSGKKNLSGKKETEDKPAPKNVKKK
jgi:large subunit ribosomal protein L17